MNTRLQLYNGTDWVNMPLKEDIPISINLEINDVRNPDSVKSSNSKTVIIPFSNESCLFFELIYQVNVELNLFNPNLKTRAEVYHGERRTMRGYLQLIKCNKIDNGTVTQGEFECSLVGESGNIFTDMGDMYLHELDLSDLDHTFNGTGAIGAPGAASPTIGVGYAYPFIDYGTGNTNNTDWSLIDLKPGVFEREYLQRIFDFFGYTWTSTFLDSNYYKRRFIPCVNEGRLKLGTATINASQFYAGRPAYASNIGEVSAYLFTNVDTNGWGTVFPNCYAFGNGNPPPPGFVHSAYTDFGALQFSDETTAPWFDGGNVYNNATSVFTAPITGYYELGAQNSFNADWISSPPGATQILPTGQVHFEFHTHIRKTNGLVLGTGSQTIVLSGNTGLGTQTGTVTATATNIFLTAGTTVHVGFVARVLGGFEYLNSGNVPVTGGSPKIRYAHHAGGSFYAKITSADINIGNPVTMNDTIPRDYKVRDFFKSIIQTFNLRVEPSKIDPYNLIIEPYVDFYSYSGDDWTGKIDIAQMQEVIPMGELDWKTLNLSYKQDSDYYNTDYQQQTGFVYGDQLLNINNEFIKNEKKIEVIFSPTPIAKVVGSPMAVAKIYKQDSNSIKPMRANIRVVYWGGNITCAQYNWNNTGTPGLIVSQPTTYPYVGHVDDPNNPTLDLSFDNPFLLYWNFIGLTYTNNNIYNNYWKRYIEEVTDPDSKIVRCEASLDEVDISNFSFRNIVFIRDAYYYVNKIIDYNPLKKDTCKIELLKLKTAPDFEPEVISGGSGGVGQTEATGDQSGESYRLITGTAQFNYSNNDGHQAQSYGQNNYNQGGLIVGEGNSIF